MAIHLTSVDKINANMIKEDSDNRFVTDNQIINWENHDKEIQILIEGLLLRIKELEGEIIELKYISDKTVTIK